jgi:hypothetical protein
MTSVPCLASFRAVFLPNPRLPPVTKAMGVEVLMGVSFGWVLRWRDSIGADLGDKLA